MTGKLKLRRDGIDNDYLISCAVKDMRIYGMQGANFSSGKIMQDIEKKKEEKEEKKKESQRVQQC